MRIIDIFEPKNEVFLTFL